MACRDHTQIFVSFDNIRLKEANGPEFLPNLLRVQSTLVCHPLDFSRAVSIYDSIRKECKSTDLHVE